MEVTMGISEDEEIALEKNLLIELYGWYLWAKNGYFRWKRTF
jgi:hypothetical protein